MLIKTLIASSILDRYSKGKPLFWIVFKNDINVKMAPVKLLRVKWVY